MSSTLCAVNKRASLLQKVKKVSSEVKKLVANNNQPVHSTGISTIEIYSTKISVDILFDFMRNTKIIPEYNNGTKTLTLRFPELRPAAFENHAHWNVMKQLQECGITVDLIDQVGNKRDKGTDLCLVFPKNNGHDKDENGFIVKWTDFNDIQWSNPNKKGNRFTINIFSKKALATLKKGLAKKSSVVQLATNDVIQNDFSSMPGMTAQNSNRRIIIDAGHGGTDHGAIGCSNTSEKTIALQVAKALVKKLKNAGYQAHLTRNEDKYVPLVTRSNLSEQLKADAFISIHLNSSGKIGSSASGVETYFLTKTGITNPSHVGGYYFINTKHDKKAIQTINEHVHNKITTSKALASCVQQAVINTLNQESFTTKDRGVKEDHLRLLLYNNIPSTLIEIGFITNPDEAAKLQTVQYQNTLAAGIAHGVHQYFAEQ